MIVGISGARQNAAVAAAIGGRLVAFCEQERVTRNRSVGLTPGTLPVEALDAVLAFAGCSRNDVHTFVTAESEATLPGHLRHTRFEHHLAHAATAALTSHLADAAVLVCDQDPTHPISVWNYRAGELTREPWPRDGAGLAAVYSQCAEVFGFPPRSEHRLEALARVGAAGDPLDLKPWVSYNDGRFVVSPGWQSSLAETLNARGGVRNVRGAAAVASAVQRHLGDVVVELVQDIRKRLSHANLCLSGGLFYNTYFNTRVASSGAFDRVFVPLSPGNTGLAAGAALAVGPAADTQPAQASPFLGPGYTLDEIKATLDNCKLTYDWLRESEIVTAVVEALTRGELVGWFEGRMEWGLRALGHRSILANPFSPHVLDNLNLFLKKREPYRAYGLSVCDDEALQHFRLPAPSPFMEFECEVHDWDVFRFAFPDGARTLRVQTIPKETRRFRDIHRAFGAATGTGVLINTSFNGFHEPIVCSPRDAVRVFYESGLDMLVLDRFVIRK